MNLAQIIEDALTQSGGNDVFVYRLDGVVVDVEIGIHDHERGRRQRVRIDVVTVVSAKGWDGTDRIQTVVDYDYLFNAIRALNDRKFDLQETLCGAILDAALTPDAVLAAAVTTRKMDVYKEAESVGLTRFRKK
ncbi:dihydroneopterin aldolase [Hyphobacterium sp. SN044]|uniref:dihydroneopterin aldolase n=1 Tax=Hyphobacterium sp. SN044 TaxID=2912575 RepID=UPI001F285114|nr:dihydroneopterin aldolase [Hyphobacterium sp. SN044]